MNYICISAHEGITFKIDMLDSLYLAYLEKGAIQIYVDSEYLKFLYFSFPDALMGLLLSIGICLNFISCSLSPFAFKSNGYSINSERRS